METEDQALEADQSGETADHLHSGTEDGPSLGDQAQEGVPAPRLQLDQATERERFNRQFEEEEALRVARAADEQRVVIANHEDIIAAEVQRRLEQAIPSPPRTITKSKAKAKASGGKRRGRPPGTGNKNKVQH